jgi:hypothetical protein
MQDGDQTIEDITAPSVPNPAAGHLAKNDLQLGMQDIPPNHPCPRPEALPESNFDRAL